MPVRSPVLWEGRWGRGGGRKVRSLWPDLTWFHSKSNRAKADETNVSRVFGCTSSRTPRYTPLIDLSWLLARYALPSFALPFCTRQERVLSTLLFFPLSLDFFVLFRGKWKTCVCQCALAMGGLFEQGAEMRSAELCEYDVLRRIFFTSGLWFRVCSSLAVRTTFFPPPTSVWTRWFWHTQSADDECKPRGRHTHFSSPPQYSS